MNHVLIIDADLENCKRIKYSLQNADTAVYYTHSVMEALAMIRQTPYTLIIAECPLFNRRGQRLFHSTIKRTAVCHKETKE